MSHTSTVKVNQKEYLKKYLSGGKHKKKKKEKKRAIVVSSVKIIDDDLNVSNELKIDEELLLMGEDAPQIVDLTEEKPETTPAQKWKSIPEVDIKPNRLDLDEDLWGKRSESKPITKDVSPPSHIKFKQEQHRTMKFLRKDLSDHNKTSFKTKSSRQSDSDNSPPRRHFKEASKSSRNDNSTRKKKPDRKREHYQTPVRKRNDKTSIQSIYQNLDNSSDRVKSLERDQSPARKKDQSSGSKKGRDPSPIRRKNEYLEQRTNQYYSPVRNNSCDQPPIHKKHDDQSAVRKKHSKISPTRKKDYDLSPDRRRSKSPVLKRNSHNYSTDRKNRVKHSRKRRSQSKTSKRKHNSPSSRSNSSEDKSPQRKATDGNFADNANDQSPVRRQQRTVNRASSQRRRVYSPIKIKEERLSEDLSPSRKPSATDQSAIKQKYIKDEFKSPNYDLKHKMKPEEISFTQNQRNKSTSPPPSKATKTLEGKKAGLQDAKSLRAEEDNLRLQEDRQFAKMSPETSGRDAEVQVRSGGLSERWRGRKINQEDPETLKQREEHEKKRKEQYTRWGRGLKQIEDYQTKKAEEMYEGSKPLARYADDVDLDRHLREQERIEDPMLEYMRKKKREKRKEDGIEEKEALIYKGPYPPNRYNIRPGYRWDGVDRSNGYENKWFEAQAEKRSNREDAYKYSVEEM